VSVTTWRSRFHVQRGGEWRDERYRFQVVTLKATHMMSRFGWRIHRIRGAEALEFQGRPNHISVYGRCGITFFEQRVITGSIEALQARGGVLCPSCHKCRCAWPCEPQCLCSTRCHECSPAQCWEDERRLPPQEAAS
jgi:hypothetical protein